MKRGIRGCEVDAGGINHHIIISSWPHPLKIWSRPDDLLLDAALAVPSSAPPGSMSSSRCRLILQNVSCRARPGELHFSTCLCLGPAAYHPDAVDALVSDLALSRVADARVKDLSGGERQRESICVEDVRDPAVLILDEPTSGLDSALSLQILATLCSMADSPRGRTVALSIHQPGARIIVLLLAAGSVLHQGSVDALGSLLADVVLCLQPHMDTVEFAIDFVDDLRLHLHRHQRSNRCTLQQLFQLIVQVEEVFGIPDILYGLPMAAYSSIVRLGPEIV